MRKILCFCILALSLALGAQTLPVIPDGFHAPFWRAKKKVFFQMQDKQKIVVSASTDKDSEGMYELKVVAGGVSRTPYAFTKKQIQDYEALPQADSHFKSAQLDPKTQILKLHIATMGYHARMSLKLRTIEKDNNFQIHWESVEGHFVGMKGVVELVELERQKTEISMTAKYRASKLPLPRVLMGAGLEVVGRLSAYKLRSFIQHKYRN